MNEIINSLINDITPISSLNKGILQFNDYNLSSLCGNSIGIIPTNGNLHSLDNIIIESFVSEILDGGTILDKRYGIKQVKFEFFMQRENYSDLISRIQDLKKNLHNKNGKLYSTINGVVYTYEATCTDITIPDFSSLDDFIENIGITFSITSPHAIIEESEVSFLTKTADFEKVILNAGNYKTYPKFILVGKSGANITGLNIEIKQAGSLTGESVNISETINNGDVLICDFKTKEITLNGLALPFSGFMMPLETGNNVIGFTFTGTANFDIYILYNKVFI